MKHYPLACVDGRSLPYEQATVPFEAQALRYALSVFEGIRGYKLADDPRVEFFALDEHLARLLRSLQLVGLPTVDVGRVAAEAKGLLKENSVSDDCYLRIGVSAITTGDLNVAPTVSTMLSMQPMGRKPSAQSGQRLSVLISDRRKPSDVMFPQRAKCIANYAGSRLALLEAKSRGFDSVILRSADGLLAEAPTANLFLIRQGRLSTPRLSDGILDGITRDTVFRLAQELGLECLECALSKDDAYGSDAAFLCGTGLEFAEIGRFDDRVLPGAPGLLQNLVAAYFRSVRTGDSSRHQYVSLSGGGRNAD